MTVHLIKLCVGAESVDHLATWQQARLEALHRAGETAELAHVTRQTPRRAAELLAGGSLYWVIKGLIQVRQRLVVIRPVTGADGLSRCALVLDAQLVATRPQPRRAFQGWRYLQAEDAPADIGPCPASGDDIPAEMRQELAALALL